MLLELKEITKTFDLPSGSKSMTVLDKVSLEVNSGDTISITGPSGSGKSTLLNIIGSLDQPTSGRVLFSGQDLSALSESEQAKIRNREIGFIFQLHHLLPQCTVLENVLMPTIPLQGSTDPEADEERARSLLAKVGLKSHLNYFPAKLSGGERQRVAVVRALINRPSLILADEPTGSLDQTASENLGRLLLDLNQEKGTALILVTHSQELAAQMGRVYHLTGGHLKD